MHLNGEDFKCEHCGQEKDTSVRRWTDDDISICNLCWNGLERDDPAWGKGKSPEVGA